MTLRFGLKRSQNADIDELRDVWRIADDAGFESCWVMDHFATLGPRDDGDIFEAWTQLAAMAEATSRTRIGCAVVGNTYRHPGVLAKTAVTVDHLSGGRLEFGIGAGWAENEHTMLGLEFGTRNDRADRLEEAVQIIRSLWTQPRTTFDGRHYQVKDAVALPKPVQQPHPPIWIGGSGPKRTLRITAEYADVWNAAGGTPEAVAESGEILDRHCADVGRDPAAVRRSVQLGVGDDADELLRQTEAFARVGITEILLILRSDDTVAEAERTAELLPRLREVG
ncbi:MAG: LLM class F420-dependent oxidoreductase [Streptosporangiales bacterium]|nr:LLM class F420-dependent oxidoreductase [Streptosporangiales bacterium]MBO0892273.1 LLM class F420-dependent oxidoreductase [Acidothermales bacterium]